jgi:hypothetical protein
MRDIEGPSSPRRLFNRTGTSDEGRSEKAGRPASFKRLKKFARSDK